MTSADVVLILILLITSASGFFLKYHLRFNSSLDSCITPLIVTVIGIVTASQLRDFSEALIFLLAATAQFASFVFVSRLRQRGSFFWHAMASLAANGTFYLTMHALDKARAYWWLFAIYIVGIIAGRIVGASWSQYIEHRFKLKSDATRDPRMAPGQRLHFIVREKTFWALTISLVSYVIYGLLVFEKNTFEAILIVIVLSILQNLSYSISSRVGQRGNNWLIASTGILSGITFYLSTAYLFSKNMTLLLLVPYILATTLGSTSGAFISMIIERATKLAPDKHLDKIVSKVRWQERLPHLIIMAIAVTWMFLQQPIFNFLGVTINPIIFPLPFLDTGKIPRMIAMLSAALMFFMDETFQTLMSRAGNRNHTGYHTITCIPKGLVNFAKVSYISLNSNVPDIIPVAICAGCLGSLFGKDISEKIEIWLQARMDVIPDPPALLTKNT